VIRHVSTNLHNLSHGHFGTLVSSAFVIDSGPIYVWLPGLVCLLALAELTFRSRLLVATFAAGHIGATLLVAAGLTAAVELGWLPLSVSRATDVGMSYGAAAVLGSLTAAIPGRWRPAWLGWFLAVGVAVVAVGRDFTDVGHAVALALGMLVATRFRLQENWTLTRFVMLAGAAGFGYLVLASTDMLGRDCCRAGRCGGRRGARTASVGARIGSSLTVGRRPSPRLRSPRARRPSCPGARQAEPWRASSGRGNAGRGSIGRYGPGPPSRGAGE